MRTARVASEIMLVASWPTMWTPSTVPEESPTILTKPPVSPDATALPSAAMGKRPTLTPSPNFARASASVSPTSAISGIVKTQLGQALSSIGWASKPRRFSTATTACSLA